MSQARYFIDLTCFCPLGYDVRSLQEASPSPTLPPPSPLPRPPYTLPSLHLPRLPHSVREAAGKKTPPPITLRIGDCATLMPK